LLGSLAKRCWLRIAGFLPSGFWVAPPSACARRFLLEFGSLSQFHTGGCYSFDCPASPEKEDPSATAATSALYSAGPVVSDLHLFYKAESWQRAVTLGDSTPQ